MNQPWLTTAFGEAFEHPRVVGAERALGLQYEHRMVVLSRFQSCRSQAIRNDGAGRPAAGQLDLGPSGGERMAGIRRSTIR